MMRLVRRAGSWLIAVMIAGCSPVVGSTVAPPRQPPQITQPLAIQVTSTPLNAANVCNGTFTTHELDFSTYVNDTAIHLYDSNGAGVAVGDLDADGLTDIVFANFDQPNAIFWNQGNFQWRKQTLDDNNSRAVNVVDVDGDGWLDVVFSHRASGVSFWRNKGAHNFERQPLDGVNAAAYVMNWADLNRDGTLDLVTGSYAAELTKAQSTAVESNVNAGVYVYEQRDHRFSGTRLSPSSQALALAFIDLNNDNTDDIVVGNDFDTYDGAWLQTDRGWISTSPFAKTSHSTMSFDVGDVDNDGIQELFATDMKPYDVSTSTMAEWLPMMATMSQRHAAGDPQIMENVLQMRTAQGGWQNQAYARTLDATGWSWSGKFGDLNNDGLLDVYVVNGMIAKELFGYLPNNELVEQNQALQNTGNRFMPMPQWNLGSQASGRGMTMADFNNDGNLDIVVNNLNSPAQVFENNLCAGNSIELDLRWNGSQNSHAIGARATLYTSQGTYLRDVRVGSGYLSGDAPRMHFGVPADATVQRLDIAWPDGQVSTINAPPIQHSITATR